MKKSSTSLLIGATGFVGRSLAEYLVSRGEKVIGTYFGHSPQHQGLNGKPRFVRCDVRQRQALESLVADSKARNIYFLSAKSSVREAWLDPVNTVNTNFMGGLYLLEFLRRTRSRARVLIFSSGTTYGDSFLSGRPLDENACQKPKDPYSVSKLALDAFARLYGKVYGLQVMVARLSNWMGPGQSRVFSVANFAHQVAAIEAGKLPKVIRVGNLAAKRDYLDVWDGVRALYLVMKKGVRGQAYHVCSGQSRKLEDVLRELIRCARIPEGEIKVIKKKTLMSRDEIPSVRLSSVKLRRLTGWKPEIPFSRSLLDILEHARREAVQAPYAPGYSRDQGKSRREIA